jgi:hypothetical protein
MEVKAEKSGKAFKKTYYEKRFKKRDADTDGILTREEREAKASKERQ